MKRRIPDSKGFILKSSSNSPSKKPPQPSPKPLKSPSFPNLSQNHKKFKEFFNEAPEPFLSEEAMIHDIDQWESKNSKSRSSLQNQSLSESIKDCGKRFEKLRNLSMKDMQFSLPAGSDQINLDMLNIINKIGEKEEARVNRRASLLVKYESGFTDNDPSKVKVLKSQDLLSKEHNQEIATGLLLNASKRNGALVDEHGVVFLRNFKCLQSLKMEEKIESLLKQAQEEKWLCFEPQRAFDFSKEFKMFKEISYNTQSLAKAIKNSMNQAIEMKKRKKEERKALRIKHTRLCGELARINWKIESDLEEDRVGSGHRAQLMRLTSQSCLKNEIQRNSKKQAADHLIGRIEKIKESIEALKSLMEAQTKEINDLKEALGDAEEIMKRLLIYILENEEEYFETSLRPVVKELKELNEEIPRSKYPKFIDDEALRFLEKVTMLETKAENILKRKTTKGKNWFQFQMEKNPLETLVRSPVGPDKCTSFSGHFGQKSFDFRQAEAPSTLENEEIKSFFGNQPKNVKAIRTILKKSCGSLSETKQSQKASWEAHLEQKTIPRNRANKAAHTKHLFTIGSDFNSREQDSHELFRVYKEIKEISMDEVKRLKDSLKNEANAETILMKTGAALFGMEEAKRILEEFKIERNLNENKKKKTSFFRFGIH